jgi:hypothetical protein
MLYLIDILATVTDTPQHHPRKQSVILAAAALGTARSPLGRCSSYAGFPFRAVTKLRATLVARLEEHRLP